VTAQSAMSASLAARRAQLAAPPSNANSDDEWSD
jgi:hypothetical protein